MAHFYKTTVLIVLLFAAAGIDGCKKQPAMAKLPADTLILAFGDSLTYGTGASGGHDYPSVLAQLTALEVINSGIPGEISGDGLARLPEELDEYQPQLLILIHGGNDMIRKIPRAITAQNLRQMIAAAKQRNIPVLLLGVPQPGLLFLDSAEMYAQIAEQEGVPVNLEVLPAVLADNKLKSDLIHPNDAGYRKLAEAIVEMLQEAGGL
ncbi:MAG: GDSL-type esterase/lipase family protein [Gammaproteobacteria bacterium]